MNNKNINSKNRNNINNLIDNFSEIILEESSKKKIKIYNNLNFNLINEIELEDGFWKKYPKYLLICLL